MVSGQILRESGAIGEVQTSNGQNTPSNHLLISSDVRIAGILQGAGFTQLENALSDDKSGELLSHVQEAIRASESAEDFVRSLSSLEAPILAEKVLTYLMKAGSESDRWSKASESLREMMNSKKFDAPWSRLLEGFGKDIGFQPSDQRQLATAVLLALAQNSDSYDELRTNITKGALDLLNSGFVSLQRERGIGVTKAFCILKESVNNSSSDQDSQERTVSATTRSLGRPSADPFEQHTDCSQKFDSSPSTLVVPESKRYGVRTGDACEELAETPLRIALDLAEEHLASEHNPLSESLELFGVDRPQGFLSSIYHTLRGSELRQEVTDARKKQVISYAIDQGASADLENIYKQDSTFLVGLCLKDPNICSGLISQLKGTGEAVHDFANRLVSGVTTTDDMSKLINILPTDIRNALNSNSVNKIRSVFGFQSVPSDQLSSMPTRMGRITRALGSASPSTQPNEDTESRIVNPLLKRCLTPTPEQLESASFSMNDIKKRMRGVAVALIRTIDTGSINDGQTLVGKIQEELPKLESFKMLPSVWQEFVLDICAGRITKIAAASKLLEILEAIESKNSEVNENLSFSLGGSDLNEKLVNLGKSGYVVCYNGQNVILCKAFSNLNNSNFGEPNYRPVTEVLDKAFVAFPIEGNPGIYNIFLKPEETQPQA